METEIAHPLVFQCANCRAVVGDSLAFHSSDEELNCITLTRMALMPTFFRYHSFRLTNNRQAPMG